jgi:hypothetical protein
MHIVYQPSFIHHAFFLQTLFVEKRKSTNNIDHLSFMLSVSCPCFQCETEGVRIPVFYKELFPAKLHIVDHPTSTMLSFCKLFFR